MPYFTYILRSLKDGRCYFGSTWDLNKRLKYHNSGKVKSTKPRRPLYLYYQEEFNTKTEAIKREHFFKSVKGRIWLEESGIIERGGHATQ